MKCLTSLNRNTETTHILQAWSLCCTTHWFLTIAPHLYGVVKWEVGGTSPYYNTTRKLSTFGTPSHALSVLVLKTIYKVLYLVFGPCPSCLFHPWLHSKLLPQLLRLRILSTYMVDLPDSSILMNMGEYLTSHWMSSWCINLNLWDVLTLTKQTIANAWLFLSFTIWC